MLDFVDPNILNVFREHQLINGLQYMRNIMYTNKYFNNNNNTK